MWNGKNRNASTTKVPRRNSRHIMGARYKKYFRKYGSYGIFRARNCLSFGSNILIYVKMMQISFTLLFFEPKIAFNQGHNVSLRIFRGFTNFYNILRGFRPISRKELLEQINQRDPDLIAFMMERFQMDFENFNDWRRHNRNLELYVLRHWFSR